MLGFQKKGDTLTIDPCVSQEWNDYTIQYKHISTLYKIEVFNPDGVNKGVLKIFVDGNIIEGDVISLVDDGATHDVVVMMGK